MKKIYFKNNGQDLLWIVIDKYGFIINCNAQKTLIGFQVILELLKVRAIAYESPPNQRNHDKISQIKARKSKGEKANVRRNSKHISQDKRSA